MYSIYQILLMLLQVAKFIILAHIIMSWLITFGVLNMRQPVVVQIWTGLNRLLEPVYGPIRRTLPNMGGIDLASIAYTVTPAEMNAAGEVVKEAAVVELGNFIAAIISFIIVAFVMFMIIKGMNNMQKKEEEAAPAAPPRQEVLLEEIRNLLAKQS